MIEITIPVLNHQEVRYTIEVLVGEFLGLDHVVSLSNTQNDVTIDCGSGQLRFYSDYFLSEITYSISSIPQYVRTVSASVGNYSGEVISIFEGSVAARDGSELDVDILGSTFFMLSRWEEYANVERDAHDRFSASSCVAYKNGFLHRPVVNEYVELLWALLKSIGCTQKRRKYEYKIVPTHDVDRPYLFNTAVQNIRMFGGYLKRGDLRGFMDAFKYALSGTDPWDTHDLFMDLSEDADVKSYFFFLPKGNDKHDGRYNVDDKRIKELYKRIARRGHHIGLHPSYNTFNNIDLFKKEKEELENAVGASVRFGRQHYLRFAVPTSFQIWDECDMQWDSTLSYADVAGFRCGVCYPFPVYDIENRKQLNLVERPLIVMEGSLFGYEKLSLGEASIKIENLKSEVKKYNGEFIFLYHNSSFFDGRYRKDGNKLLRALYA